MNAGLKTSRSSCSAAASNLRLGSDMPQEAGQLLRDEAGCSPPAHSMISDFYPPEQRSMAMGVSIRPGRMALTRTPNGAFSMAMFWVMALMPAFAVL